MNEYRINILQKIDAYVKGSLSEEEIQGLWNEFAKDPSLLEDLELEVGVKKLLEERSPDAGTNKVASVIKLPVWTWHAAAAAVLVLVALIQLFKIPPKTEMEEFIVSTIPNTQIETGDGVRAKDMIVTTADSLLSLGFSAFVSGNYNQAMRLFDEVIENHDVEPYGSKAYLNKGILLYNSSDYDSAAAAFLRALDRVTDENRMISEKAYWYLGNTLVNLGEPERAREAVQSAYSLNGVFRKPAFLLLQKLNYDLGYVDYEDFEDQIDN